MMKSDWDEYVAPYLKAELIEDRGQISELLFSSFRAIGPLDRMKIERTLLKNLRDKDPARVRVATILTTDLHERGAGFTPTFHHYVQAVLEEMVANGEVGITGALTYEQIQAIGKFGVKGTVPFLVKRVRELEAYRHEPGLDNSEYEYMLEAYLGALLTLNAKDAAPLMVLCFAHDSRQGNVSESGLVGRLLLSYWRRIKLSTLGTMISPLGNWEYEERNMIHKMIERVADSLEKELSKAKKVGLTDLDAKSIKQIAFDMLGISP